MNYEIVVSDIEINEVMEVINDRINRGEQNYPNMSYEEGVKDALEWLFGQSSASPI